jgi:hypothetical protein
LSFSELGISIVAQNLASAEFSRVASDAGAMAAQVSSQRMSINAENLASPEINRVAEDAARVKTEVEGSPISLSFGPIDVPEIPPLYFPPIQAPIIPPIEFPPIEAPSIPPIDVSSFEGAQVTFGEVGASAIEMGENVKAAGSSFTEMQMYAEDTTVSLRTVAGGIRTTAMMGTELTMLASDFGIVDKETSKYVRTVMAMIMVVSTAARMYSFLTLMTTGHTAAVAVEGTTTMATAGALSFSSIAHGIYSAAKWAAVAASNALNISTATFLALTGVGIAVIVAATVAMWAFANSMNAATSSAQSFNAATSEVPSRTRGIQRAGEEDLYRRGVE